MTDKNLTDTLGRKKLFVFDMDGTVYLGNRVFDAAVRLIHTLRAKGRRVLFFTNNASHSPAFYQKKLNRLGFDVTPDEILTSGDVTAEFLKRHRPGKTVLLLGTPDLVRDFRKKGIVLVNGKKECPDVTVTSFDTTLTYEKLRVVCDAIRHGSEFLSTHPDYNCPTETGFVPDSGAVTAFISASTGKIPVYFGKPYAETVDMIAEVTGVSKAETLFIGDRLYTDIAVGKKNGVDTLLVLTGETTKEDLVGLDASDYPDFVLNDLSEVSI